MPFSAAAAADVEDFDDERWMAEMLEAG